MWSTLLTRDTPNSLVSSPHTPSSLDDSHNRSRQHYLPKLPHCQCEDPGFSSESIHYTPIMREAALEQHFEASMLSHTAGIISRTYTEWCRINGSQHLPVDGTVEPRWFDRYPGRFWAFFIWKYLSNKRNSTVIQLRYSSITNHVHRQSLRRKRTSPSDCAVESRAPLLRHLSVFRHLLRLVSLSLPRESWGILPNDVISYISSTHLFSGSLRLLLVRWRPWGFPLCCRLVTLQCKSREILCHSAIFARARETPTSAERVWRC